MKVHARTVVLLLLVSVATIAGSLYDAPSPRAPIRRDGRRVLEVDFHSHTRFSDGFLSPFELVLDARKHGLDAFALTEHNAVFPAFAARAFSELVGGPTVIIGEEITTSRFHVIGVGLTHGIAAPATARQALDAIHAQGGVTIAAHPVRRFWPAFDPVRAQFDAAEVLHPVAYTPSSVGGFRWEDMVTFYERAHRDGFRIAAVGSSDYHFFGTLGVCRTLVFTRDVSANGIVDALRRGDTVVLAPDGRRFGNPELLAILVREPIETRSTITTYAAHGPLDWATRALGFVAVVALVVWRRRRAKPLAISSAGA